jgi:hypothetical protein
MWPGNNQRRWRRSNHLAFGASVATIHSVDWRSQHGTWPALRLPYPDHNDVEAAALDIPAVGMLKLDPTAWQTRSRAGDRVSVSERIVVKINHIHRLVTIAATLAISLFAVDASAQQADSMKPGMMDMLGEQMNMSQTKTADDPSTGL